VVITPKDSASRRPPDPPDPPAPVASEPVAAPASRQHSYLVVAVAQTDSGWAVDEVSVSIPIPAAVQVLAAAQQYLINYALQAVEGRRGTDDARESA